MMKGQTPNLRRRRARRTALLVAALFVLVAALVTFGVLLCRDAVIPADPSAVVQGLGARILALWDETLHVYSVHGRQLMSTTLPGAEQLAVSASMGAAYGEHDVYLLNGRGMVTVHFDTSQRISSVSCGAGLAAIVTQQQAQTQVSVYDAYGNSLDVIAADDLLQQDCVMDAGMYANTLWVLTVNTSGAQIVSRIYLFNAQQQAFMSRIDVQGQLIYDVAVNEKNVLAIGTQQILCYTDSGVRQWQSSVSGMYSVFTAQDAEAVSALLQYDGASGCKWFYGAQTYTLAQDADAVAVRGKYLYLLCQDTLVRCTAGNELKTRSDTLSQDYQALRTVGKRRVLLFDGAQWISRRA